MNITLNGKPKQLAEHSTVLSLLQLIELADKRVAVEINGDIIPRSQHPSHLIVEGDQVEIVVAVGGG